MNRNDPICMEEFTRYRAPGAFTPGYVTRSEAARQFRFSLALVLTLAIATIAVAVTMPLGAAQGDGPQMAHNSDPGDLTYTIVR